LARSRVFGIGLGNEKELTLNLMSRSRMMLKTLKLVKMRKKPIQRFRSRLSKRRTMSMTSHSSRTKLKSIEKIKPNATGTIC
jgi:hypothetical protein